MGTVIVLVILVAIVGLIVRSMIRDKKWKIDSMRRKLQRLRRSLPLQRRGQRHREEKVKGKKISGKNTAYKIRTFCIC